MNFHLTEIIFFYAFFSKIMFVYTCCLAILNTYVILGNQNINYINEIITNKKLTTRNNLCQPQQHVVKRWTDRTEFGRVEVVGESAVVLHGGRE